MSAVPIKLLWTTTADVTFVPAGVSRWRRPGTTCCWGRSWRRLCRQGRTRSTRAATSATLQRAPSSATVLAAARPSTAPTRGRGSWLPRWPLLSEARQRFASVQLFILKLFWSDAEFMKHRLKKVFPFSPFQCLRLLMHTFNREYSQVSSSASESKVSPSLGPLTRPVNPSEPLPQKY